MTVKCQVLSGGFDGGYFLSGVNVNYFSEGGNAPGRWFGAGAKSLQLDGVVEADSFRRLLAGYHPRHDKALVQFLSRKAPSPDEPPSSDPPPVAHCPGFDLQFSVPKSVSTLWAAAETDLRRDIEVANDRAIKRTLSYAEENLQLTRRGKNGHRRETAKLVVAMFDHVTSRNGDPLLHRHCVINNVCQRHDGTWGTIDSRTLHNWARTLGPLFRSTLAVELRKLGLELTEAKTVEGQSRGYFEVAGVPESLIKTWSSRREEMLEHLEGEGKTLGDATAKAKERAAIHTRAAKNTDRPRSELHAEWRQVAAEHGFTPEKAAALFQQPQPDLKPDASAYDRAWQQALTNLTQSEAHFTERRLIQEVAEQLQTGQMTGTEIAERVRSDLDQERDIVPLRSFGGDRCFTTQEMWDLEKALLKDVESLKERPGAQVSERIVKSVLKRNPQFNSDQTNAVETLLTSSSAIRAMTGVAGAGKSTTLRAVKEGLEAAGYEPMGVTLSGVAKEELAAATGMPCRTVASLMYHTEKTTTERVQDRIKHEAKQILRAVHGKTTYQKETVSLHEKSVLIIDEAGMKDTRALRKLLRLVEEAGATAILAGDYKQLQPIDAGGPFRRIAHHVPSAHLSVNMRQQDAQDRDAVAAVREGRAADALQNYVDRGRVTIGENKRDTLHKLVETWARNGGTRRPEQHVIFTQTRAEAAEVNRQCQAARLEAARTPHFISARHGDERFYRGDRVLFHKTDRRVGIENGFRGTVVSVDPIRRELKVRLDTELTTKYGPKSRRGVTTIPLKKFADGEITLGYASTTHKSQGATVPHAYVCLGGRMTDNEMTYVQVTRAKKSTHLFVDRSHAGDDLKDLIDAVEQSRVKVMAHDKGRHPYSIKPETEDQPQKKSDAQSKDRSKDKPRRDGPELKLNLEQQQ